MEDIYEELSISQYDLADLTGELTWEDNSAEVERQFRASATYAAIQESVQQTARTLGAPNAGSLVPEFAYQILPSLEWGGSDGNHPVLTMQTAIALSWEFEWKGRPVGVTLTLGEEIEQEIDMRLQWKDKALNSFYYAVDQSSHSGFQLEVEVDGQTSSDLDEEIKKALEDELGKDLKNLNIQKYFQEEIRERLLENIEIQSGEDMPYTLGEQYFPTPFGFMLFVRLDANYSWSLAGELTGQVGTVQKERYGVIWKKGDGFETFCSREDPEYEASVELHILAQASADLTLYTGVSLLTVFNASVYGRVGATATFEGHGVAQTGDPNKVEIYAGITANAELGVNVEARLLRSFRVSRDVPILEGKWPLWEVGLRTTPYRFTVREGDIFINSSKDLTSVVSLNLDFMDFKVQDAVKPLQNVPFLTKEFERDRYQFEFVTDPAEAGLVALPPIPAGVSLTPTGFLSVPEGMIGVFTVWVKLTYTGYGEDYKIWKVFPVHYVKWEETPDFDHPFIEDPSGYVYEGIESNRLSGVTTTLYYSGSRTKPTSNAVESQKWNSEAFGQMNPLTTDALGQYLWMVPDGWWQVKYEKAGYETVYSQWLPVPPVQTEVNVSPGPLPK